MINRGYIEIYSNFYIFKQLAACLMVERYFFKISANRIFFYFLTPQKHTNKHILVLVHKTHAKYIFLYKTGGLWIKRQKIFNGMPYISSK